MRTPDSIKADFDEYSWHVYDADDDGQILQWFGAGYGWRDNARCLWATARRQAETLRDRLRARFDEYDRCRDRGRFEVLDMVDEIVDEIRCGR